jgi:nucleoside-diphosphate-sugar epimerase
MQRRVLVACVRHMICFYQASFFVGLRCYQERGPLAFDLIGRLLREGCKVTVVGDLQMDTSRNLKTLSNLFNLELTKFVLLILSISKQLIISRHSPQQSLSEMSNIDQIYHLACPTRDQYEEDPIQALESCFIGTKNLLDVALRCNARIVLAASSGSRKASGVQPRQALWDDRLRRKRKRSTEAAEVVKPAAKRRRTQTKSGPSICTSFYEEGNRLAEMLCSAYEQHFGLEVRIARVPEAHHQPTSKNNNPGGQVLEVNAPAEETVLNSEDTTLVESAADDGVLQSLIDLMEAPAPRKATSSKAGQTKSAVLLA